MTNDINDITTYYLLPIFSNKTFQYGESKKKSEEQVNWDRVAFLMIYVLYLIKKTVK